MQGYLRTQCTQWVRRFTSTLGAAACAMLISPGPALAQSSVAREIVEFMFSNQELHFEIVDMLNPPEEYRGIVLEHLQSMFGSEILERRFLQMLGTGLDTIITMPAEARGRLARELAAGITAQLASSGLSRLPPEDLRFMFEVLDYSVARSSIESCARMFREEFDALEMSQWELSHIFSMREEFVRRYFRVIRTAVFSEAASRPARRQLSATQREVVETVLTARLEELLERGEISDALLYPQAASDAALCNDNAAFIRIALEDEGLLGDWMLLYMALGTVQ